MSEKIIVMLLIAITGAGLTALRRWNNPGRNAGIALSGWTIALLGMIQIFDMYIKAQIGG